MVSRYGLTTLSAPASFVKTPGPLAIGAPALGAGVPIPEARESASLGSIYEITQPPPNEAKNRRLERYALQSAARSVLPRERVAKCLRVPLRDVSSVDIWRSVQHDRFHYANLSVCGSVWLCPVCASKISEKRRVELSEAFTRWQQRGGSVYLLTLTVPHYSHQRLSDLLEQFNDARRRLRNRKTWKNMAAAIQLQGSIRGLEVTYGSNGWHVHTHELLFLDRQLTRETVEFLQDSILTFWQKACVSAGLPSPNHHGVSLDDGNKASQYVTKWGLEHEMTKSHSKKGREGGRTPFDFLRALLSPDQQADDKKLSPSPGQLFSEYAQAFKGRRQLVWSDGLRQLLGLDQEKTDEELAKTFDDDALLFAQIPLGVWRAVRKYDKRGEVLEESAKGLDSLFEYLSGLYKRMVAEGKENGTTVKDNTDDRRKRKHNCYSPQLSFT